MFGEVDEFVLHAQESAGYIERKEVPEFDVSEMSSLL
jgi:hypothetical protein